MVQTPKNPFERFIAPSSQFALYQTLHTPPYGPYTGDLEASRFHQRSPLLLRAFSRRKVRHHDDVKTGSFPVCICAWDDILIQQQLAVPPLHGRDNISQYATAVIVCPVMQQNACSMHGRLK